MMSFLLKLICLQQGYCLTFKHLQQDTTRNALCNDDEYNTFMTPYIASIQNFFVKEKYSFYPFALSAIGALRYGSNSVVVDGKRHLMDHDVDFFIAPGFSQEMNKAHIESLFQKLTTHLASYNIRQAPYYFTTRDLFLFSSMMLTLTDIGPDFLLVHSKDAQGRNYSAKSLRLVTPPNDLTRKAEREVAEIGFSFLKRIVPERNIQQAQNFVEKVVLPGTAPQESSSFVGFDFFFSPDGNQGQWRASNSKRMLFYGMSMDYPANADVMLRGFQASAWDPHSRYFHTAYEGNVCNFHIPDNVFTADAPAVYEEFQIAKYCSQALSEHGFESLAKCLS